DHEKDKDLTVQIIVEPREGHEREVGGVEHQFERHVDDQDITADDHAEKSEREQQEADNEIMFEAYGFHFRSFLLNKITPTMATSSSTETTSNGSRYCENRSLPSSTVPALKSGARVAFKPAFLRLSKKMPRMVPTAMIPPARPSSLILRRSSAFKSS